MCKKSDEGVDHLFVHCRFSLKVWAKVLSNFNVVWVIPQSSFDL